jgi:hypothetical protein
VDSLGIHLVGNEWVREWTLLRTTQRKRGPLVIWTDTSGEISVGMLVVGLNPPTGIDKKHESREARSLYLSAL